MNQITNKSFVAPFYLKYKNRGLGDVTKECVKWGPITSDSNIASNFIVRHFIHQTSKF